MDPLHFCIAVAPLAVYLLLIGLLNLSSKAFVTTGARDAAALGIGISGMVIAGPMELFFPEGAASQFGGFVWLMLIVFYGLCITLVVLLMRSRIVVYNISVDQLMPVLKSIAHRLDKDSRWAGDMLMMPNLKVHLHVESAEMFRNIQLCAGGNQQSYEGWRALEIELRKELRSTRVRPNLSGIGLLIVSGILSLGAAIWLITDQQAVAQAFTDMLRR
jgi:hypothetical protein